MSDQSKAVGKLISISDNGTFYVRFDDESVWAFTECYPVSIQESGIVGHLKYTPTICEIKDSTEGDSNG